jgi:predicted glycosyltransferase
MFYVQHLLGIGHQRRGATLTRAMQAAGLEVTYVSGGRPVPDLDLGGAELIQLPSLRAAHSDFKQLFDENNRPVDDSWKGRRRDLLLETYRLVKPHALILELYPFGRRQMRFELLPLLAEATSVPAPPVVISSIRDILEPSGKPERLVEIVERVDSFFDHVMVHGDRNVVALDPTFAMTAAIDEKITCTGYVVDDREVKRGPNGAVGERLLRCAMAARGASALNDRLWRILVGISVEAIRSSRVAGREGLVDDAAGGNRSDTRTAGSGDRCGHETRRRRRARYGRRDTSSRVGEAVGAGS